jgi:uncharacterized protein YwqG
MTPEPIRAASEQIAACFADHPALGPWQDKLRAMAAPCIIQQAVEDPIPDQGCRFGGEPVVPEGFAWPSSPFRPMHFVGQIDFAELAAIHGGLLPDLPRDGVFAFFADIEEIQGASYDPEHRHLWKTVYIPAGTRTIRMAPPPFVPTACYQEPPPACGIKSHLSLSIPDTSADDVDFMRELSDPEEVIHAYYELHRYYYYDLFLARDRQDHQVCGHGNWVQHDDRVTAQLASNGIKAGNPAAFKTPEAQALRPGAADWRLLWQIGSDEISAFYWNVDGALYIVIREQDLKAAAFDKCWVIVQGG